MSVPEVYGDAAALRRALGQRIKGGKDLLKEIEGSRLLLPSEPQSDRPRSLTEFAREHEAVERIERRYVNWLKGNRNLLNRYLANAAEGYLPQVLSARRRKEQLAADWLDAVEQEIATQLGAFGALIGALPVRRGLDQKSPRQVRLEELQSSNLLAPEMLSALVDRMSRLGRRRRLPGAIAAAKELVEATMKAALGALGEAPAGKREKLPQLEKRLRVALIQRREQVAPEATLESFGRFSSHVGGLVVFLAEWRNEIGEGHGRRAIPSGLARRHAQLAVDIAEAYVRFVVTTLDDLAVLPPQSPNTP